MDISGDVHTECDRFPVFHLYGILGTLLEDCLLYNKLDANEDPLLCTAAAAVGKQRVN